MVPSVKDKVKGEEKVIVKEEVSTIFVTSTILKVPVAPFPLLCDTTNFKVRPLLKYDVKRLDQESIDAVWTSTPFASDIVTVLLPLYWKFPFPGMVL